MNRTSKQFELVKPHIAELASKHKNFIYKVDKKKTKNNSTVTITVFAVRKSSERPLHIGTAECNTASYKGDFATANMLIAEAFNYKNDGYRICHSKVTIYEV